MVLAASLMIEPLLEIGSAAALEHQQKFVQVSDFAVISDCMDYIYPQEYFYDTNYHLNDKGKEIRTMQLIEDVKE